MINPYDFDIQHIEACVPYKVSYEHIKHARYRMEGKTRTMQTPKLRYFIPYRVLRYLKNCDTMANTQRKHDHLKLPPPNNQGKGKRGFETFKVTDSVFAAGKRVLLQINPSRETYKSKKNTPPLQTRPIYAFFQKPR